MSQTTHGILVPSSTRSIQAALRRGTRFERRCSTPSSRIDRLRLKSISKSDAVVIAESKLHGR
jgi:hypothetical protein